MRFILTVTLVLSAAGISSAAVIENEFLRFSLDYERGTFQLIAVESGLPACNGGFGAGVGRIGDNTSRPDALTCVANGQACTFLLERGSAFLTIAVTRSSNAEEPVSASTETPSFLVDFNASLDTVRVFGCDGLTDGNAPRTGYTFLAATLPGHSGVVAGWLTQHRASGITLSTGENGRLAIRGRAEYGHARHIPNVGEDADLFAIGLFADPLNGLEAYGAALARANAIVLDKPIPSGYCTWYSQPHGGASDQRHLAELTDFCAEHLKPYGFELVQIDDMWQAGRARPKDVGGPRLGFLEHHPKGPYRDGMTSAATHIREKGMTPGLWFIPFAADPANEPAAAHPEWFVKTAAGEPYFVYWAGWSLDMTHDGARDYVSQVVKRITGEWGFKYIKIDGLWSGMATTCLYPTPDYREDDLGGAVFHDPASTNIAAYRSGLALVRDSAGDDVFILGCNIAQNMRTLGASIGRVDGMRVGRDIGADWNSILPCAEMGARLYFFHNRVWYNDPDCLMVREPLTMDQARAWASWIAVTGQMNLVSEWLPGLPPERLDLVKRSMPNHGMNARPLDLFECDIPRVWLLSKEERHIIAVFNWDALTTAQISVPLKAIGQGPFSAFEYWGNAPAAVGENVLDVSVAPASCKVFAVRPATNAPHVVSTSRHITQGMIDLVEERWDAASRTLSGVSRVVGGDPYEIRVALPESGEYPSISSATSQHGTIAIASVQDAIARVVIESEANATVSWQMTF